MATVKKVAVGARGFDYEMLPRDVADKARASANRIHEKVRRTVENIIHIGWDLAKAKAVLGHGPFGRWLRAEFDWSERTAENFMAVAERFGPISEIIADCTIRPTAAYLLAAPSVPDDARVAAIRRARAGETITTEVAKEIIAQWNGSKRSAKAVGDAESIERLSRLLNRYTARCNLPQRALLVRVLRQFADTVEGALSAENG